MSQLDTELPVADSSITLVSWHLVKPGCDFEIVGRGCSQAIGRSRIDWRSESSRPTSPPI